MGQATRVMSGTIAIGSIVSPPGHRGRIDMHRFDECLRDEIDLRSDIRIVVDPGGNDRQCCHAEQADARHRDGYKHFNKCDTNLPVKDRVPDRNKRHEHQFPQLQ